ncbi:MAG: TraR/DksA C4-type zinc finger protein [Gammaproteobacteria bacterium]|nr:TraR/DksA C4-type zinc finger protein [Gammaproteobacteria bacterium]
MLTGKQLNQLKGQLQRCLDQLLADIRGELRKYDNERYAEIAGAVHDPADESFADMLVDTNLAEIDRDVNEVRDVEGALMRIRSGTYGACLDCGEPIELGRLKATPAAARCMPCQRKHEVTHSGSSPESL